MSFTPGPRAVSVVTSTAEIGSATINLSEDECKVFSVVLETIAATPELNKTTVRVAGGWVRDKVRSPCVSVLDTVVSVNHG